MALVRFSLLPGCALILVGVSGVGACSCQVVPSVQGILRYCRSFREWPTRVPSHLSLCLLASVLVESDCRLHILLDLLEAGPLAVSGRHRTAVELH